MLYEKVLYKIPAVKGKDSQYNEFLYILKETNGYKGKVHLQQAMRAQRGSRGIALLFL